MTNDYDNFIKTYYDIWSLDDIFTSKKELKKYLKEFDEASDYDTILHALEYYGACKGIKMEIFYDFKVMMLFSIIEKFYSEKGEYVPFDDWITSSESYEFRHNLCNQLSHISPSDVTPQTLKPLFEEIREKYYDKYGSSRTVLRFFDTEFNRSEKVEFLTKIKIFYEGITEPNLPYQNKQLNYYMKTPSTIAEIEMMKEKNGVWQYHCFDKDRCYFEYMRCYKNVGKSYCPILSSDEILNNKFRKFVKAFLQGIRNAIVHDATIPYVVGRKDITKGVFFNKKSMHSELSVEYIEDILDSHFKNLLDYYLKNNVKK